MSSEKHSLLLNPDTLDTLPTNATATGTPTSRASLSKAQKWGSLWAVFVTSLFLGKQMGVLPSLGSVVGGSKDAIDLSAICVQPAHGSGQPSNWTEVFNDEDFQMEVVKRLSKAITFPTQSFDFMPPPSLDDPLWAPFTEFRAWLAEEFPTVHAEAELDLYEEHSMVFTIEGKKKGLKPLMLTAHMDVVPAVTSLDRWTFPPFSGTILDRTIYGRGSSDCKNTLIALLTAHEYLLSSGFRPERTIILAFGQDEEVGGPLGAGAIGRALEERWGKGGIGMIVDEGGMGIAEAYGTMFALPGLAEKGSGGIGTPAQNFIIEVDTLGGHSSVPSRWTSIGLLSKIISAIEDDETLFQPVLKEPSPMWGYMQCVAKYGQPGVTPSWIKKTITEKKPNFGKIAEEFAGQSLFNRYLLETSKAVTLINGGIKVNALPESAIANINSRIDLFSDADEVAQVYLGVIQQIASKYGLNVNGVALAGGVSIGNVSLTIGSPTPPSPITASDTAAYAALAKAVQATFGADVITAPNAMTGNTDTRHYTALSENIFRFSPIRGEIRSGSKAHTVDERMTVDAHIDAIKFFIDLIMQSDAAGIDL